MSDDPEEAVMPEVPQHFLAVLGILLFFGLLLPRVLRPLHLPFATSLILVGSLLGPNGISLILPDEGLELFGFLGGTFYMLLAGTEARVLGLRPGEQALMRVVAVNSALPLAVGVAVARWFGYDWQASFFVGGIFLSSSIMLVFGTVRAAGLAGKTVGRLLMRAAILQDLTAAVLSFLLFQTIEPNVRFPLPILAGLLFSSVVLLRMFLPEVVTFFFARFEEKGGDDHESRLRLVIALFLLVIFAYSAFDVHPIIAAFLVGFALAEIPGGSGIQERLETLGYGLFIPVFLFVVGLDTDLRIVTRFDPANALAVAILVGATLSKVVSGFIGGRWAGLTATDAWTLGVASTAKLAVPLTATFAARDLGILDGPLFSAIIVTSVIIAILAPLIVAGMARLPRGAVHG